MPLKPPPGWIDVGDLLAEVPKSTSSQWRSSGLLPEPVRIRLGRGKGSASYYPPGTDALVARLREPREAKADRDALVWDFWLDPADYPVDMRRWVLKRLNRFSAASSDPRAVEIATALKDESKAAALIGALPRRHPLRIILGNLGDRGVSITLLSWALDIAAERDPLVSLYDPRSSVLTNLLKGTGLPRSLPPPDKEINPEMISVAYLEELVKETKGDQLAQVRSDCRAIAVLARTAEAVDWNAVGRALDDNPAFVALTSEEPRSYRARRAKRHANRKNQLKPQAIRTLLALWRNFDLRAFVIPGLIYFRDSPDHGRILSEIIAISDLALARFPRRAVQRGVKSATVVAEATQ